MKRVPLFAKIFGLFLVNVLVLAAAAWLLAWRQFGLEPLLSGGAGERVRALATNVAQVLRSTPTAEWTAELGRFEKAYGIRMCVFNRPNELLGGSITELPPEVIETTQRGGPGANRPRGFGRENGGPRDINTGRDIGPRHPADPPGDEFPPPPEGAEGNGRPRPPGIGVPQLIRFLKTPAPGGYWLIVRLAPPGPRPDHMDLPGNLVIQSNTLSAGGLIFDFQPLIWATVGALLLSALIWIPFVASMTRTISRVRSATNQIALGRFDVRIQEKRTDEIGELGEAVNAMAERLTGYVTGQKRFLSDIAHELCAPLSRLQMALGILEERSGNAEGSRLQDIREEVDQMAKLVDELLAFSKASLGSQKLSTTDVLLDDIIDAVVRREAANLPNLERYCEPGLVVRADPRMLERALGNLVRNAIRYAAHAGVISLTASAQGAQVTVIVADQGPGVPECDVPRLFEPFFRVDTSRTRETGGVGLGLTITKSCIEACGGTIAARNRRTGGLEVEITLQRGHSIPVAC